MQPRLVKTEQAQYEKAEWTGSNLSGRTPIGDMVIVLPDPAAETVGELGVLHSPEEFKQRMTQASETGVVVAVGEGAFVWSADRARPFEGRKPQPGDRVDFARYAGRIVIGQDGKSYRLMTDSCISSIMDAEQPAA